MKKGVPSVSCWIALASATPRTSIGCWAIASSTVHLVAVAAQHLRPAQPRVDGELLGEARLPDPRLADPPHPPPLPPGPPPPARGGRRPRGRGGGRGGPLPARPPAPQEAPEAPPPRPGGGPAA